MRLRKIAGNAYVAARSFRAPSVAYCAENGLLPEVFVATPAAELRRLLFLPPSSHERETQLNQDIFGLLINRLRTGFFLEIGANDGFSLSNTVYLEENFDWDGLLIEANPGYRSSLEARRADHVIAAVANSPGYYSFSSAGLYGGLVESLDEAHYDKTSSSPTISVWGAPLQEILDARDVPPVVDFISVDVEGAELDVVRQICTIDGYRFRSGCIEHNNRDADYREMSSLLRTAGYEVVWPGMTRHDLFFIDLRLFR